MKNLPLILALLAIGLTSCNSPGPAPETDKYHNIRFNQVGYYPDAIKEFVVADYEALSFQILNDRGKEVFEGESDSYGRLGCFRRGGSAG